MNLEEQISSVLNDPEAMSKISALAGSLGLGGEAGQEAQEQPAPSAPPAIPGNFRFPDVKDDNRARLLIALKPFLSEKRAPYVDGAVALLSVLKLGSQSGALGSLLSAFGGRQM